MLVDTPHRPLLSEHAKSAIARELGVADLVATHGWGAVSSHTCGSVVRVALEHAMAHLDSRAHDPRAVGPGRRDR